MAESARSRADAHLAGEISSPARRVSAWQVERWRQAGLIPAAHRTALGRGGGSTAWYPPEAVEQARLVASLVRRRRPLSETALVLFARRYPISVEVVRAAYIDWLDGIARWLRPAADPEQRFEVAERRAAEIMKHARRTRQGRRMRARVRGGEEHPDAIMLSVFTNLFLILQGEEPPPEAIRELLDAGGVGAAFRDRAGGIGPLIPGPDHHVLGLLRRTNLQALREAISEASESDFASARDLLATVAPFAKACATLAGTLFRLPDAFGLAVLGEAAEDDLRLAHGVPFMLLIRELADTAEARALIRMMREQLHYFQASAGFVESLPNSIRRRLSKADPRLLDELPPDQRDQVRRAATAIRIEGRVHGYGDAGEDHG